MKDYQNILIPVDGSEPAKHAALKGLSLAKLIGAKVTAVNVVEQTGFFGSAPVVGDMVQIKTGDVDPSGIEKKLESLGSEIVNFVSNEGKKMGVDVETKIIKGHPADQIVNLSNNYDLIVLSTLGKSCVTDLLMGGVADKVARHAKCPILLVREKSK